MSVEPFGTFVMDFQKQPLRPKKTFLRKIFGLFPKNKEDFEARKISSVFATAIVIVAIFFIYKVISTVYFYASNFKPSDLVFVFVGNVQQDSEKRTNFLLLGTGGGEHDGPDLTDTIIVASYNHVTKHAGMLSIPRDLYVDMPGYGSSRINKIYETLKPQYGSEKALQILMESSERVTNLDIHYYMKVDFAAFKDIVDVLDGVDIEVSKTLNDTLYPDGNNGYETFRVDAGLQHMDGDIALKYARSRHSTSDFDRAQRQQQLIMAIKEKALQKNILTSIPIMKSLWDEFRENVETNMSLREMLAFVRIAKAFDTTRLVSKVLKDIEIVQEGGFLYTPERILYGGAFVLRPWGETYEYIHKYTSLVFGFPEVFLENARIEIQNGSGVTGIAGKLADFLLTYGFNVVSIANTPDREIFEKTSYFLTQPNAEENSFATTMKRIITILPVGEYSEQRLTDPDDDSANMVIIIGNDFPNGF